MFEAPGEQDRLAGVSCAESVFSAFSEWGSRGAPRFGIWHHVFHFLVRIILEGDSRSSASIGV